MTRHVHVLSVVAASLFLSCGFTQVEKRTDSALRVFVSQNRLSSSAFLGAANELIALREKEAIRVLRGELAAATEYSKESFRVYMACRVLFTPKGKEPLRRARFGKSGLPEESMPMNSWPMFPIVQSNSSFFMFVEDYEGTGIPERLSSYLDYCVEQGAFRTQPLPVPAREECERNLKTLLESMSWNRIRWASQKDRQDAVRVFENQLE